MASAGSISMRLILKTKASKAGSWVQYICHECNNPCYLNWQNISGMPDVPDPRGCPYEYICNWERISNDEEHK